MKSTGTKKLWIGTGLLLAISSLFNTGCITYSHHAIPADRLPPELRVCQKGCRVPVNLALLAQTPPRSYVIGAGDVLSIYIRGLIPANADESAPVLQGTMLLQRDYYPPAGNVSGPAAGVPIQVAEDGTIPLPVLGPVKVDGLTVQQAADKLVAAVVDQGIVLKGKEYIYVNLVRPRVHRIIVVREETETDPPTIVARNASIFTKRGSAQVVDLPAFENDILHALTASGGMPGIDAMNEVWILRREQMGDVAGAEAWKCAEEGQDLQQIMGCVPDGATAKRIPLWTQNGESPCFSQSDVILQDGDVVYLRARQKDVFFTGGLITGSEIPLPRDYDIDILEAVSIANASVGGPGGAGGQVFKAGAGVGNIIPPTRALVLRKMPNGQQVAIRVDLERAMRDAKQRIVIQPGDFIMLYYKPGETFTNAVLNLFNYTFAFTPFTDN
jgi:protein involved in polysaccharide export with SLBB domain